MELKDMSGLAITLLVTVIVISLGASVLGSFQSNMQDLSTTHANITFSWPGNNTAVALGENRVIPGTLVLWNNNVLINQGSTEAGVGNYTYSGNSLTITNISGIGGLTGGYITSNAFNVSYSYNYGSPARNGTGFGLASVNTMASYLPIVALVSIAALVVGVVLVMFRRRN